MLENRLDSALHSRTPKGATDFSTLVFTFELVPARASKGKALDDIILFSEEAARDKRICALSITDNAGGHPALTPHSLGAEIKALGIEPIIHFSCKDKNRNLIESELFELDRSGLNTLLVLTGDFPRFGYKGRAKPVFDLDSVLVLSMIQEIKKGLVIHKKAQGGGVRLPPMDFYAGCVVSPFKRTMAEQIQQYMKLKRKLAAGAQFIITQMGYDVRKYQELRLLLDVLKVKIPVMGTVLIPDKRLARLLYRGVIPGCTMPARLLAKMEQASSAQEMDLRLDMAARLCAVLCGIGYQGVHLSGPGLKYSHIREVINRAEEYFPVWQDQVAHFLFPEEWNSFIFQEDEKTGLNTEGFSQQKGHRGKAILSPSFIIGRFIHWLFFRPGKGLYPYSKRLAQFLEKRQLANCAASFEYFIKELLYDCQRCGDCYLGDMEFMCPQSQCAKNLVNGPCGGSNEGWCEVLPGKKRCLFVRQFERARMDHRSLLQEATILPPRNWALDLQSSWINFFTGKDHHHMGKETGDED